METQTSSKWLPSVAALVSVLFFSTGGFCIKGMSLSALPLSGLRSLIAVVFFALYITRRFSPGGLVHIKRYGMIAAVGYVVMTVGYVVAMKLTTAANAIFLQYTMPAWVLIGGAVWLGEKITFSRCFTILLCLIGMALFFVDELQPEQWQGNIIALLSGFGFAVVTLSLRKGRDQLPIVAVLWGNALTALLLIPYSFLFLPDTIEELRRVENWLGLLWLGVFQIGVAYLFFVYALRHLPAIEVAILSLIEPILNPTWVYLLQDERPSTWAYVGGAFILVSVLVRTVIREKSSP